eukprot:CAMPEP_0119135258 /NCGR_PEP_ID=MMETSP1310-20130426/18930_1 /TAXON_ID=464262 /ORGANISM="Genus nov. species nov., Strain RCC2339" /LENGTH=31 /DNA_ID= /DNA_START= /DNA_END= /DNA_ORIENTATION=
MDPTSRMLASILHLVLGANMERRNGSSDAVR